MPLESADLSGVPFEFRDDRELCTIAGVSRGTRVAWTSAMPNPIVRLACASLLSFTGLTACSSQIGAGSGAGNQAAETATDAGADLETGDAALATASDPSCTTTFTWYQKDAYANHAGRTSQLWPPHTTTQIDSTCDDGETFTQVRENHGSKPSDVDANGTPLLVVVKVSDPVSTPLSQVQALLTAYEGCECQPTTPFLSLDALGADQLQQMITPLASYVQANLTCSGADIDDIVGWIESGDMDSVLAVYDTCSWSNGDSWGDGFVKAAQLALGDGYDSYHVCNNDAQLESALWRSFAQGKPVTACDSDVGACRGPVFIYDPASE